MSFERLDRKFAEAAENGTQFSLDPAAWDKMETLLDLHLPKKKKRRGLIFLLLGLALLLGGGIYFTVNHQSPNRTGTENIDEKTGSGIGQKQQDLLPQPNNDLSTGLPVSEQGIVFPGAQKVQQAAVLPFAYQYEYGEQTAIADEEIETYKRPQHGNSYLLDLSPNSINPNLKVRLTPELRLKGIDRKKKILTDNLFFTLGAGPDLSAVGVKLGKVQFNYGLGLGYEFSDRVSVRTGIYFSRKIYTASPEDYKGSVAYYPNLKKVDADCRIYEIPVLVNYGFLQRGSSSFFVSGGLSSYIMKKEKYDYTFRPPYSPQDVRYTHTYQNENNHLFSTLHLSAGFTKKISPKLSIQTEPYFKLPLSGIGEGSVRLNSAGLSVNLVFGGN